MDGLDEDLVGLLSGIDRIGYRSGQFASLQDELQDMFEVHSGMVEVLCGIIEILHVHEDGYTLFWISYDHNEVIICPLGKSQVLSVHSFSCVSEGSRGNEAHPGGIWSRIICVSRIHTPHSTSPAPSSISPGSPWPRWMLP